MKKILKHGDLDIRKFKCPKCNCEFLADSKEYDRPSIDAGLTIIVFCPECYHKFTTLDSKAAHQASSIPITCRLCTCTAKCIEIIDNNSSPVVCTQFDKFKKWRTEK